MTDKIFKLENINLSYKDLIVFKNFNIDFHLNSINIILGSSGSGKTSLLNIISSHIAKDDKAFVYQDPRLLNYFNCYKNIEYVLKDKIKEKDKKNKIDKQIKYALEMVGLTKNIYSKPSELSGGMRQRLSLARALAYDSNFILMDEPLQGQDIKKKKELIDIIKKIQLNTNKTFFYVTHDVSEAVMLGDYLYVLSNKYGYTKLIYEREIKNNYLNSALQSELIEVLIDS
ncbi:ATP-binding cassette domain-containing protein [Brachyspira murdochii]|uniref:ABC transporter related protein n=1 Tax=Brachyspira murdochii (strain ATCC 51284 / DSM 12563 / 56-150) TaxID=526224 RepID=D5U5N2_BRAM5|nr:ATP-binding cassette domain-containing protein [Brachyspira murdochii]ADG72509.1 ABC transporter related protein [Brachyspira murdochii DSM 12563]